MKNTAKKIQPVKKTKRAFIALTPADMKMIYGGKGGIDNGTQR